MKSGKRMRGQGRGKEGRIKSRGGDKLIINVKPKGHQCTYCQCTKPYHKAHTFYYICVVHVHVFVYMYVCTHKPEHF